MDRLSKIILPLILIFAFAIRIFGIEKSPPSLNWDEATLGYNAYSLLKTGKDEFGEKSPLNLRSFDDYKGAIYSYTVIPFIKLVGLNATAIRFPSVISGTIIVFLAYLFTLMFFKNYRIALLAAFLIAIEPWSLHFSRAAFEANLAVMLFLTGIYLVVKFKSFLFGGVTLILSALTYHAEKVLVFPVAILAYILNPTSLIRLSTTSIFAHYQSPVELIKAVLFRYFSYFSPINLFVRGTPEPSQHIPNFGMFHPIEFLFLVIGVYFFIKNIKDHKVLAALILISPIPGVLTWNWFYPARVLPLFFFLSSIIAYGLSKILNKFTIVPILILLASSILNLFTSLYFYLPYQERGNWQYGMKEMVGEITKYQNGYEQVVIETKTAQPYIFLLLYSGYDPGKYQEFSKDIPSPRKSFDFNKYVFRDIYWDKDKYLTNILFIGPVSSLPVTPLSEVKDFEGNILYKVVGTE